MRPQIDTTATTSEIKKAFKKAAKIQKGSQTPGQASAGSVTMAQCREIAEAKFADLNANDLDQATKIIAGSARSMGLEVSE